MLVRRREGIQYFWTRFLLGAGLMFLSLTGLYAVAMLVIPVRTLAALVAISLLFSWFFEGLFKGLGEFLENQRGGAAVSTNDPAGEPEFKAGYADARAMRPPVRFSWPYQQGYREGETVNNIGIRGAYARTPITARKSSF